MLETILWLIGKSLLVIVVLMSAAAGELLMMRKVLGYFQMRLGPNRVGPWGVLQPLADVVKMIFKEDIVPRDADKVIYRLAPIISFFCSLAAFVVIPWGPSDATYSLFMADPGAGILIYLAIVSLSVYGITLGGWASQSKYALLGAMRGTAQLISYELALGMSLLGVILMAGSPRLTAIVEAQQNLYNIIPQFLGFLVFALAVMAEANWPPFDLPESEQELVAGYHTEYAGMRFGLYFLSELIAVINASCLITLLYLGGWNRISFLEFIPPTLAFLLKVCFVIFVFFWIRATLPRIRYDKLMNLGWKVLLPVAALNLVGTAVYVALSAPRV